jgi:hypothetical protein
VRASLASLTEHDVVPVSWPRGGKAVFVHMVTSSARTLYRCPVVIVRHAPSAPLAHRSTCWNIGALFGAGKEEHGLDHSQRMSAHALLRLWTLAMLASVFLEEEPHHLSIAWQRLVAVGEARREIPRRHRHHVLIWLHEPFLSGVHLETLVALLAVCCGLTQKCKDRDYSSQKSLPDKNQARWEMITMQPVLQSCAPMSAEQDSPLEVYRDPTLAGACFPCFTHRGRLYGTDR